MKMKGTMRRTKKCRKGRRGENNAEDVKANLD